MNNVLEYLEQNAYKYPNKIAVGCGDNSYTYNTLLHIAKRLGSSISSEGITNHPIAVLVDRGIDTLVFFLAVLYSGNYYVPIDVTMPDGKLQAIYTDAAIEVTLGSEASRTVVDRLSIEQKYVTLSDCGVTECDIPAIGGDDPAYMIYTSGSTGKPKGVLKSHGAIISFVEAYCATFDFSHDEVIGNQSPLFFDASAKDIYMMLYLGCTLDIIPDTVFSLPPELMDYMNAKKITFASWVPTVISLVATLNPFSMVKPETLKKLFFVGEVMPMKHLNKWRKALPDIQYVNLYGQSELAGICCYYEVKGEYRDDEMLPIGHTLSNCEVYLVDGDYVITESEHMGELYIVSDALALKYYNDSEKTESCFVIRDFGDGPVRAFRTGDLASYDTDGNLRFSSRADYQIKHMGHRIELGEIESVVNGLEYIDRCCCLYNADKRRIVLFCSLLNGYTYTGKEIISELRGRLSNYMVPSKVIVLDKMPLNANNKINRQELMSQI